MSGDPGQAGSATTATFTTSLVANSISAGVQLAIFIAVRALIKAVYEPRTYIPTKDQQAPVLGRHILWPLWRIIRADAHEILDKNGVDPYVFVRFLHMMAKAMVPIWLLSWAVLLPINSVGMGTDKSGLDQFTAGNIVGSQTNRLWAHLILDYVFVFWLMYLMWGEMEHWLVVRQKFLINPQHSKLPQANTVLVQGIPPELLEEEKLAQLFSHLPGGVQRIWINRNLKELPKLYNRRLKATAKLESAQIKLIKFAGKYRSKREKTIKKLENQHKALPNKLAKPINADMLAPYRPGDAEEGHKALSPEDLGKADQLVPRNKRPTHRLKPDWAPFPLGWLGIGRKVDTIDWARNEISTLNVTLEEGREQVKRDIETPGEDMYPPLNSAFIYFNQQIAAHMAEQILLHHKPYNMSESYIEQSPENVVWYNLNLGAYQLSLRRAGSIAITTGVVVVWTIPAAFIGALASVTRLTEEYSWMAWLKGDSGGKRLLQGVITGILPPVLLALVNLLLPVILRLIITFQGIPSRKTIELTLMTRYFVFLVYNTFFVITLTGGVLSSLPELIADPISIAQVLASNMPNASTFFITLILTQFTGTVGTLLQPITLVIYYLKVILGGGTPRSVFNSRYRLQRLSWGQQFPAVTVYAVIMLAYMVISPLITGFGACFFLVAGTVFKYLFIWVYDQPPHEDTGGLFFPKAITQVFVGMYIQQIALCAWFFIVPAIPQGALMVVLIVVTAGVHYTIVTSYRPLINALPLSLAHLSYGMPKSELVEPHPASFTSEVALIPEDAAVDSGDPIVPARPTTTETDVGVEDTPARDTAPGPPRISVEGEEHELDTFPQGRKGQGKQSDSTGSGTPTQTQTPPNGDSDSTPPKPKSEEALASPSEETDNPFFAIPGGPGVRERHYAKEGDPDAFLHPASRYPQRTVWLPRDDLGLCDAEVHKNREYGVKTSSRHAMLTKGGKVRISGRPPDDL